MDINVLVFISKNDFDSLGKPFDSNSDEEIGKGNENCGSSLGKDAKI